MLTFRPRLAAAVVLALAVFLLAAYSLPAVLFVAGVLGMPLVYVLATPAARTFARWGDRRCLGVAMAIGAAAGVLVAAVHIPYLGSLVHGTLALTCGALATGLAAMTMLGLASLAARDLNLRTFLNSPEEEVGLHLGEGALGQQEPYTNWLDI